MSVPRIDLQGDFGDAATSRAPSPNIWFDCPWEEIDNGTVSGIARHYDFLEFPKTFPTTEGNWGQFTAFSSAGATLTAGTGQGGEIVLGAAGDNEGISFRTLSTPYKIIRGGGKFWWEARLKTSTVTNTKHGFFLGLMQDVALTAVLPIKADGTLADTNFVGFHRLEGDGVHLDTVYKCDGVAQVTVQADAATIAADTCFKVGMRYDDTEDPSGSYYLSFWKNGSRLTTAYQVVASAGTDFPNDIALGLVFGLLNATGTAPGTTTLDWLRVAQRI